MGYLKDIKQLIEENKIRIAKRKEKEARQKEIHKQERIKRYKELCKKADRLIKEAQEQEKMKKMEQLQALLPKRPQKALNQVSEYTIYSSRYVERDNGEKLLYNLNELKNIETMYPDETGRINWDVWNRLVEECRNEFKKHKPTTFNIKKDNHKYPIYVYNRRLQLIGEYPSATQCAKALNINSGIVTYWAEQERPHKKLGIIFSKDKKYGNSRRTES